MRVHAAEPYATVTLVATRYSAPVAAPACVSNVLPIKWCPTPLPLRLTTTLTMYTEDMLDLIYSIA